MANERFKSKVDELGALKAQIAKLVEEEDAIVAFLKSKGVDVYVGDLFEANVFEGKKSTTNWKGLCKKHGITDAQIARFTKSKPTLTCKVTSRILK